MKFCYKMHILVANIFKLYNMIQKCNSRIFCFVIHTKIVAYTGGGGGGGVGVGQEKNYGTYSIFFTNRASGPPTYPPKLGFVLFFTNIFGTTQFFLKKMIFSVKNDDPLPTPTCVHARTHACSHTHTCTHAHTHACAHACTHTCVHVCAHTRTRTHTHTHSACSIDLKKTTHKTLIPASNCKLCQIFI